MTNKENVMNQEHLESTWNNFKGSVRSMWGKITDDDLERAKGNLQSIAGLIQERYGDAKEDIKTKFDPILKKFADRTEETKERLENNQSNFYVKKGTSESRDSSAI